MSKSIEVVTGHGEFEAGTTLTRGPAIAAYIKGVIEMLNGKESTLTAPEILRTINATDTEGMEADDAEVAYIEALNSLEAGIDDEAEEAPALTIEASTARQVAANTVGSKLNGQFNAHLVEVLDAGDTIKKGPFMLADDCVGYGKKPGKWTREEVEAMPLPGSKADPKDKTHTNKVFDLYKVTVGSETVRGSWYGDIILATKEGERVHNLIEALQEENGKAKSDDLAERIKLERARLNNATNVLRKAITVSLVIWKLESLKSIEVEIQREADGTPMRTMYPVILEQRGLKSSRRALTLSQLLYLLKPDKDGDDGIDRTIKNGGTMKALVDHGLPKKAGKQPKAPSVVNADRAYDVIFALNNYLDAGGDGAIIKALSGPKSEHWVSQFGDMMTKLVPIWQSTDIAERYKAINTPQSKAKRNEAA